MDISAINRWQPPLDWGRITTIDAHTGGEPLRVFVEGFPEPRGNTILERRRDCLARLDHLRRALMWEPRGHADMYGCIITPPERADSDFGVLFTHNEGYSSMCGHGIIAVVTVMLETGAIAMQTAETEVRIDSPAGLIVAWASTANGRVLSVRFHNVPSFAALLDASVSVRGRADVRFDLAFGGAFYALVDAGALNLDTSASNSTELIALGREIKQAVMQDFAVEHPFDDDLSFLYGVIFTDTPKEEGSDTRNVCIFAEGELDRSPTGTGVSARLAVASARGELAVGQARVYESVIGSQFSGSIVEQLSYGPHAAIVPEVCGSAHITGRQEFLLDPDDKLLEGFLLR